jgi:nucleotide-binding universal stress UspA family protein
VERASTVFDRILVPTDFSVPARRAVDLAVDVAKQRGATITLLHVYELPTYPFGDGAPSDVDFVSAVRDAAQKELDGVAAVVERRGVDVRTELLCGVAWDEILRVAEVMRPDLLVMGTHGRTGLARAVLGSVTEKVVRMSAAPVLTVRDPGESGHAATSSSKLSGA